MKKILLTLILAFAASAGTLFAQSGTCGENLTWKLSGNVLTLSGTGEMTDYSWTDKAPWFYYVESIHSAIIENGVSSIGKYAFCGCTSMTSVTIGNSVTSIGSYAFCGSVLTSLTIPNSVTSIGNDAFLNCSSLTSVTIPNRITSIESYAFSGCTGLTSVQISDLSAWCEISFSESYSNPLCYAKHLYLNDSEVTDLVIPNCVTNIGNYAFYNCSGLTSVTIPNSVTSIGDDAFSYCTSLAYVELSENLDTISRGAFYSCPLISLLLPASIDSIGGNAFIGHKMTTVYCQAETTPALSGDSIFYNHGETEKIDSLFVPTECVEKYIKSSWVNLFKTINGIYFGESVVNEITSTTATIKWEPGDEVSRYVINLYQDITHIAEYTVNESGSLISYTHYDAPIRPIRKDTTLSTDEYYVLTLEDLNACTTYHYTINGYNEAYELVYYVAGSFATLPKDHSQDALQNIFTDNPRTNRRIRKIIRDWQLLIQIDDRAYAPSGIEVQR